MRTYLRDTRGAANSKVPTPVDRRIAVQDEVLLEIIYLLYL